MTTIAVRGGVIAADGQVTGGAAIITLKDRKIFRLPNGNIVGVSGPSEECDALIENLRKNKSYKCRKLEAVMLDTRGRLYVYEGRKFKRENYEYYAIGSGWKFAIGAMDAGASAKKAVDIAKKRDIYSGGRTFVVSLEGPCRSRKSVKTNIFRPAGVYSRKNKSRRTTRRSPK